MSASKPAAIEPISLPKFNDSAEIEVAEISAYCVER
jgi:hypothetical protein